MEWKEWRQNGIGSSDAPVICGVSPWKTIRELWEEKTGRHENNVSNFATQRGHELEPRARAHVEFLLGCEFPPVLCEHPSLGYLRASLDGFCKDTNTVLEIKCPGREDHEAAREGCIPKKYWPQLQHQLLVTGAERALYFSFTEESNAMIPVYPDLKWIDEYTRKAVDFWSLVVNDVAPELCDQDWKNVRSRNLRIYLENYRNERSDFLRKKVFDETKMRRIKLGDYKVDPFAEVILLDEIPI